MWILGRIVSTLVVLLVVSAALFVMTRATPVSPARIVLGPDATATQVQSFEADHGLDRSLARQYSHWLTNLASEGFGRSYITNRSINDELRITTPVSLKLVSLAFIISVVGSIILGSASALAEDTAFDHLIRIFNMIALSIPGFWLALLLIRYLAVQTGWFPTGGMPRNASLLPQLQALLLPALSIAMYYIGALTRLLRASIIEVLGHDYTRTSHALGLNRSKLFYYTLKNALPSYVSMAAMSFGYMFGWAIIVELVFNMPGLSRSLLNAINQRDYPMVQATVLVITVFFILANLLSDLLQRFLNPKLAEG